MLQSNESYGVVYSATNLINGKKYIGQTVNFDRRKKAHIKTNDNRYFHNAIRKYGKDNFKWDILCECKTKEILNIMETFKIIVNHTHNSEEGYNCTWGGDDNPMNNKETRIKVGVSNTGKVRTDEYKRNLSDMNKGKILSDETRKKISRSRIGIVFSADHLKNIGLASKGRIVSEETREKISNTANGRVVSDETKKKISASLKGHKHSDETKKRISVSLKEHAKERLLGKGE